MADHPNIARVAAALEAFGAGDLETYAGFFADDVVWHVSGHHALSGTYRGKEALLGYFTKVRELTGGTLKIDTQRILADADRVGVFARVTARRDGQSLDVEMAQAFELDEAGKAKEYWALSDDQDAVDAFWS